MLELNFRIIFIICAFPSCDDVSVQVENQKYVEILELLGL